MVKYIKYAVIVLILIIVTVFVFQFSGKTTPEKQIRERLKNFLAKASKSSGDKLSTGLFKSKSLESFFASRCKFQIGVSAFSGTYTPEQISSNSMRSRSMFRYVKFSAHDVEILLKSPETATVNFTGAVNGVTKRGKSVDDYKELTCKLRLVEEKWLIYSVSIREIIKK